MKISEILLASILGVLICASIIMCITIITHQEPTVIYVNETNASNDGADKVPKETTSESSVASSSSKDSSSSSSSKGSSEIKTYDKIISSDENGHYVAESVAYNDGSQGDAPGYYKVVYNEEGPISQTRIR